MRLLFFFLFFSVISFAQGVVVERHENGQKKVVLVYSGTGINELLTKRYEYWEHEKEPKKIISYSPLGWVSKIENYSKDDNGSTYLYSVHVSKDGKNHTTTYYNPDGTKADFHENDWPIND